FYQTRFKGLTRHIEHAQHAHAGQGGSGAGKGNGPTEAENERTRVKRSIERVRGRLRHLDAELTAIERRIDHRFHPYWGSLLKEETEMSSFGAQVEEYACLYTSKVSDFLFYSPQQSFRSPRDEMA